MESYKHLLISLLASLLLYFSGLYTGSLIFLLVSSGLVGILVDLDHFLILRYRQGSWKSLFNVFQSPFKAFTTFDAIPEVSFREKMPLHSIQLSALLLVYLYFQKRILGVLTFIVLLHILSDVYAKVNGSE